MAKRSTKFGTFGGVFTPSILTILGVIMYLRLPWVVGNGGLWLALGVIAAAHLISVTTGLSISSIATDKKVGAGGPYYIVSRSLGLPIGGTLGLALFVGLSFSISLYVIGFSESFLAQIGIDPTDVDNIRICGTITIFALTIVTLISTSFAIKTQYVILVAIALSLVSIALSPGAPPSEGIHLAAPDDGAPLALIFGIFFPAVTGFTAGVNMSGDLKDPKKSIPVGTMAAIGTGLIVYVSLAVFIAWKIPLYDLRHNNNALADHARWGFLVIAGIWGATLSSGLGSIMGAPRILQALSADRVTPSWLAKGHGKDNEPRRALMVAFAIGEAGILIGDLNAIARVVSIFFIATYGFLNLSCAIESWASTDFRPEFRIPRILSVVGALVCVLMMIQLDIAATAAASVVFIGLFAWLKRRELALESGDTWAGVWSSLVRWGLEQLDAGGKGQRSWRPNVLSFSFRELQDHGPLLTFGTELIRDRGVLTDFRLRTAKDRRAAQDSASGEPAEVDDEDESEAKTLIAGRFAREIETEDPWATVRSIARFHGFAGLEPNTVLINWAEQRYDRLGFAQTLDELVALDFSLLLLARDPKRDFGSNKRVDLWWTPTQGNFALDMALIRFLSMSDDWRRSELRFLLLNDDPSRGDALFKSAQRALADARIQGSVKVFNNAIGNRPLYDWARQESGDADLVVLGLPPGPLASHPERMAALDELCNDIGSVLVTRGSSQFGAVLQRIGPAGQSQVTGHGSGSRVRDDRAERSLTPEDLDSIELVPLRAPEPGELKAAARELSLAHDELALEFHTECIGLIYAHDAALIEQLRGVVERAFDQLGKALSEHVVLRQRKQLNKIQSGFLFQARRALSEFESDRFTAQVDAFEHRVEGWLSHLVELEREAPRTLTVARDPRVLAPGPEDPPRLRRAKRRLRARHLFQGSQLSYGFNATPLYSYYLRYRSRTLLSLALNDMALDGYQALLELGRSMSEARHALDEFALRLVELPTSKRGKSESSGTVSLEPSGSVSLEPSGIVPLDSPESLDPRQRAKQELDARIKERRELVLERLDKLLARTNKRREQSRDLLLQASRTLAQNFADDIARLDVHRLIRRKRRLPKQVQGLDASLLEAAGVWRQNRQMVLNRTSLELHNAGFQQRLRTIVERTKHSTAMTIQSGILRGAELLRESLVSYGKAIEANPEQGAEPPKLRFTHELSGEFDDKRMVEELAREAQAASAELPDAIEVIGDDALMGLEDQPFEETEVLTVSLRRLVDFMVQAEFLGGLREHTARVALAEQRAVGVAQDVLHLVSFNLSEYEAAHADVELSLAERVGPAIANGLGRLDGELDQLRALATSLGERIDAQLGKILDRTEAYAITGSEDSFKQYVRHDQSGGALSRVGGATRWAQHLSKRLLVRLLYRWSAGVLLARRTLTADRGNVVEQVLEFVNDCSPKPEVLDGLPFYYSQPFLGQARVSMEFWVGREAEIDDIAQAVRNWKQGRKGALLIVGENHSGKTSLARFTARKHFEKRNKYNILPPRGGSADVALFRSRIEKELKLSPELSRSWDDIITAIPTGSVVMIHDLELWWERSAEGIAVLDQLSELIDRFGDRVLFILELNIHAYRYISREVPLADQALAVVECQPFTAEQLKDVIEGRHRSTGLRCLIDERDEDELPAWNRARLFTRHFDYSGGYVGVALHSWITHIDRLDGEDLLMRSPKTPALETLDRLKLEWVALLLQFVLHKRLTRARLVKVTGLEPGALDRALDALARMGLVSEDKQGAMELNHYVSHLLVANLRARGYL